MHKTVKQAQPSRQLDEPEQLWENLLSRQPGPRKAALASLDPSDQKAVIAHLQLMVSEPGWQPEQRLSATAALDALLSEED
jgi:hypothetical protein